jgi:hypothetical protein
MTPKELTYRTLLRTVVQTRSIPFVAAGIALTLLVGQLLAVGARPVRLAAAEKLVPLVTQLDSGLQDRFDPKKTYKVALQFTSTVEYAADTNQYRYTYSVVDESTTPIRVAWKSLEETEFGQRALSQGKLYEGSTLAQSPLVISDSRPPRIQRYGADIYVTSAGRDELVMASPAPAYVPR